MKRPHGGVPQEPPRRATVVCARRVAVRLGIAVVDVFSLFQEVVLVLYGYSHGRLGRRCVAPLLRRRRRQQLRQPSLHLSRRLFREGHRQDPLPTRVAAAAPLRSVEQQMGDPARQHPGLAGTWEEGLPIGGTHPVRAPGKSALLKKRSL